MTDDDKALMETIKDAVLHGTGFMKNGKHVPIDDVYLDPRDARIEALTSENERLVERHEAFRQEVSDAVEHFKRCYPGYQHASLFDRFIITKPDPLVEAMRYITAFDDAKAAEQLRAELAKRGLEIREKSDG